LEITTGILAVMAGGVLNGTFAYPMKRVTKWQWENIWLLFGVFGLVLFPWVAAWLSVSSLTEVYRQVPGATLLAVLALGVAWGSGSVLFGRGISALGFSLGYCIVMGTTAIFGTLVPALWLEPEIFATERGAKLAGSLVLIAAGLSVCAVAGRERERHQASGVEARSFQILTKTQFRHGLAICLLSGVLSACFNIGFAVTSGVSAAAQRAGASGGGASFPVWALIMSAGFLPNLAYCAVLLRRNRSFGLMTSGALNWVYAVLMGAMWILAIKFYSDGSQLLGSSGATIGWPILMASAIIAANGLGLITGEWCGVTGATMAYLCCGLAILLGAVVLAGSAGLGS
jgi:L-rhamnose-H+ transport protein